MVMGGAGTAAAQSDKTLTLHGRVEIEVVDVEGPGGYPDSEDVIRPRSRAPHAQLDKATLDFGIRLREWLMGRVELRANEDRARADRVYVEARPADTDDLQVVIQGGRQRPMQRPPDRRTETYSPTGAAFWRGREWHLGADGRWRIGAVELAASGSMAMQRDLGDEPMAEDPAMPALAFGDSAFREGSALELGGLVGAGAEGAYAAVFGFRGALLDADGPERLQDFTDYDKLGDENSRKSHWYGCRAGFDRFGAHAFGEAIWQRVGNLKRRGFELGASYTFAFRALGEAMEVEPLVRYGQLTTLNLHEEFFTPQTWDREQWLLAALVRPLDVVEVKLEYVILDERTGEGSVDDDEFLVQLRLESDLL